MQFWSSVCNSRLPSWWENSLSVDYIPTLLFVNCEMESCCAAQTGFELVVLQPQLLKCRNYRCFPPCASWQFSSDSNPGLSVPSFPIWVGDWSHLSPPWCTFTLTFGVVCAVELHGMKRWQHGRCKPWLTSWPSQQQNWASKASHLVSLNKLSSGINIIRKFLNLYLYI